MKFISHSADAPSNECFVIGSDWDGRISLRLGRRGALRLIAGFVCLASACDDIPQSGVAVTPGPPPVNIDEFDLSTLTQAVEVIVGMALSNPLRYAYRADLEMSALGVEKRLQERALIKLFSLYSALNAPERRPFTRLSRDGKRAWLDELRGSADSTWRAAYHVVRSLVLTAFYSESSTWASIGYSGPPAVGDVLDDSMAGVTP